MIKITKSEAFQVPSTVEVKGASSPDGTPYVQVCASGKRIWVPRSAFVGSGGTALKTLTAMGMPLLTSEWSACRAKVAELTAYPPMPLIDRPGRNGAHFAALNGRVYPNQHGHKATVLFPVDRHKCSSSGSLSEWRGFTAQLQGQHVLTFMLCIAFAGPLVRMSRHLMNVGFELAGQGGSGKSTALRLAAAVCGPVDNPNGVNYWTTANATINGLEVLMTQFNDMPLIIDETNLFAAGDLVAMRAAKFNELIFRLSDGTVKRRYYGPEPKRSRFVFATATNEGLAQVLSGYRIAVAEAAADRLMTIPIADDREHGVFDFLPKGFKDKDAFASFINARIRATYGLAMRRFLKNMMKELAVDEGAFAIDLQKNIEKFRRSAGVDGNNGSRTRSADSFGLVCAAGCLALKYGAISSKLDPFAAAMNCFVLHEGTRAKPVNPMSTLRRLASAFETRIVSHDHLTEMTVEDIESGPALMRERRDGQWELLLTPWQLTRAFPDQRAFYADANVGRIRVSENGRTLTKRRVCSNLPPRRFHCFRMPEGPF